MAAALHLEPTIVRGEVAGDRDDRRTSGGQVVMEGFPNRLAPRVQNLDEHPPCLGVDVDDGAVNFIFREDRRGGGTEEHLRMGRSANREHQDDTESHAFHDPLLSLLFFRTLTLSPGVPPLGVMPAGGHLPAFISGGWE